MSVTYGADFFTGRRELVLASARFVVPVLKRLLRPRSVLDLGCGEGEWLEVFDLPCMVGVDIAAQDDFFQHDLTEPLDLGVTFDVVLCLEVGEHLPEEAADVLVSSCARHSDDVVFSAAVPGQEGKGHINLQSHEYWAEKFERRGFVQYDEIRPRIQSRQVSPWYRENIFLYRHGVDSRALTRENIPGRSERRVPDG